MIMEVSNRSLPCILIFLWASGAFICLFLGIGIRYGVFGWRSRQFMPGEEVILLTGGNEGVFCERVELESAGYLTAKHMRIRDWDTFKNPDIVSDHYDISLADKYFEFKKYRLYPGEWLDVRVCSQRGLMMYTASTQLAFVKLKGDLERGHPCTTDPSASDVVCGKTINAYLIRPALKACKLSLSLLDCLI